MCGIAGFVNYKTRDRGAAAAVLDRMTESLAHRGPDAGGTWLDGEGQVGLGHRRLSIVDLSELGAQPMHSATGRYTIVFNGEIYGFVALRDELLSLGTQFRGRSDTEVLLASIERFGLEASLKRCNGMFAFALFDRKERTLAFARDRLGKKPIYIGLSDVALCFSSELKSVRKHPSFANPSVNMGAVTLYTRYKYVPAPYAIYEGVMKLPAGTFLTVSKDRPRFSGGVAIFGRSLLGRSGDGGTIDPGSVTRRRGSAAIRREHSLDDGKREDGFGRADRRISVWRRHSLSWLPSCRSSRRPRYALSPFVSRRRNSTKPTLLPKSQVSCEPIT